MAFLVLRMKLPLTMACPVFSHAFGRDTVHEALEIGEAPAGAKKKAAKTPLCLHKDKMVHGETTIRLAASWG